MFFSSAFGSVLHVVLAPSRPNSSPPHHAKRTLLRGLMPSSAICVAMLEQRRRAAAVVVDPRTFGSPSRDGRRRRPCGRRGRRASRRSRSRSVVTTSPSTAKSRTVCPCGQARARDRRAKLVPITGMSICGGSSVPKMTPMRSSLGSTLPSLKMTTPTAPAACAFVAFSRNVHVPRWINATVAARKPAKSPAAHPLVEPPGDGITIPPAAASGASGMSPLPEYVHRLEVGAVDVRLSGRRQPPENGRRRLLEAVERERLNPNLVAGRDHLLLDVLDRLREADRAVHACPVAECRNARVPEALELLEMRLHPRGRNGVAVCGRVHAHSGCRRRYEDQYECEHGDRARRESLSHLSPFVFATRQGSHTPACRRT